MFRRLTICFTIDLISPRQPTNVRNDSAMIIVCVIAFLHHSVGEYRLHQLIPSCCSTQIFCSSHDPLWNMSIFQYDHHTFPGVVPRTFAGPLALTAVVSPFIAAFEYWNVPKYWTLFASKSKRFHKMAQYLQLACDNLTFLHNMPFKY